MPRPQDDPTTTATAAAAAVATARDDDPPRACVNGVTLVGRMGSVTHERELPSGDTVMTFTVVVTRAAGTRGTGRPRAPGNGVDAIACAAWSARTRRTVAAAEPGTWLEVEGALRRRFRRGAAAATSFTEVEVVRVRRLR